MDITKDFILGGLSDFGLGDLPGRPYDSAFELLASPPNRKRLVMMGFNGSSVDAHITNARSIIKDYESPDVSNLQSGTEGAWCSGQQKLATALEFFQNNLSDSFGVKPPLY